MKNIIIIISFILLTILPLKGSYAWMRDADISGSKDFVWAMAGGSQKPYPSQEISSSQEAAEKAQTLNVVVKVKTDKNSYLEGEPVQISMEVINKSDKTVSAYYPSSQKYDFIITDKNGAEVWRWSRNKMFLMEIIPFQLKTGEMLRFNYVWNQKNNSSENVPTGEYYVTGKLMTSPKMNSQKIRIEIIQKERKQINV